jgi:hypothetical protein
LTTTADPTTTVVPTTDSPTTTTTELPTTVSDAPTTSSACQCINGYCDGDSKCICNTPYYIGKLCEINIQASSSSFVSFDTLSNTSSINVEAANSLPGSSPANYTFSNNAVQVAATFSDTETARRSMCLNPSLLVAGVQTFIAFKIPSAQSAGTAVEVWLTDANGQYRVSTSVTQSSTGQQLKLNSGESASVQLSVNTPYIIIIEVDSSASLLTSQVLTTVSHSLDITYSTFRKTKR